MLAVIKRGRPVTGKVWMRASHFLWAGRTAPKKQAKKPSNGAFFGREPAFDRLTANNLMGKLSTVFSPQVGCANVKIASLNNKNALP
ncbi:hypothetical protein ACQR3P_08355 [Rhodococcus sp. IEGM1300]